LKTIYISGHKSPDTDSICSALAYANFKQKFDPENQYVPVRLGNVSNETQFILDYFGVEAPQFMESIAPGEQLIQVDHNEQAQAITGFDQAELLEIIDHHRINGIFTANPIYVRIEPVGCTATIITKIFNENEVEIDRTTAGLLMSAILSDSLVFKSPTCTALDEVTCRTLAEIAGVVDVEAYGLEMLKAGTSLSGKSIEEIFKTDFKDFVVGETKFGVAQVNTMDIDGFIEEMKEDMVDYMNQLCQADGYAFLLLALTDVVKEGSLLIATGDIATVEQAFNCQLEDHMKYAPGILSRKKQIIPVLTEAIVK